jgi:MFS superfamily sulfate permease-like transporter
MDTDLFQYNRPLYNANEFEEVYQSKKLISDNVIKKASHYCLKYYRPSGGCFKNYIKDRFPIIKWLLGYNIRENLLADTISGITIGIVHIPQGLAYGLLASLPAVNGLYVSFFSVIMYVLLGTSNHLSMGTFAITSLMTSTCLAKFEGRLYPSIQSLISTPSAEINDTIGYMETTAQMALTTAPNQYLSLDRNEAKIMISMALTFLTGIFHVNTASLCNFL